MGFLSRLGKGFAAHLVTGTFTGGMAAALTNNFGIGVAAGLGSRLLGGMGRAALLPLMGGCAWGGFGGMGMGFANSMYGMGYYGMQGQWGDNRW